MTSRWCGLKQPLLFVRGARDNMCTPELFEATCSRLETKTWQASPATQLELALQATMLISNCLWHTGIDPQQMMISTSCTLCAQVHTVATGDHGLKGGGKAATEAALESTCNALRDFVRSCVSGGSEARDSAPVAKAQQQDAASSKRARRTQPPAAFETEKRVVNGRGNVTYRSSQH